MTTVVITRKRDTTGRQYFTAHCEGWVTAKDGEKMNVSGHRPEGKTEAEAVRNLIQCLDDLGFCTKEFCTWGIKRAS